MPVDDSTISLELPGFKVTRQTSELDRCVIRIEPTAQGSHCGRSSSAYHDGDERIVRDLPILGRPVYLRILQRRFKCDPCGKPFKELSSVVDWQQRQTHRYQHYLIAQCRSSALQRMFTS